MNPLNPSQMPDDPSPKQESLKQEVAELTDAIIHNGDCDAQLKRLEQLVLADDRAADYYLQYVEDSYRLYEVAKNLQFQVQKTASTSSETQSAKKSPILSFLSDSIRQFGGFIMKPTPFSVVIAFLAVSVSILTLSQIYFQNQQIAYQQPDDLENNDTLKSKIVADVIGIYHVVWNKQQRHLSKGDTLRVDQKIEIQSGVLELLFNDGTVAMLEGPAIFHVQSDNSGNLTLGRLSAQSKKGFTIDTPAVRVIDLSTEFYVHAKADGVCDVHVFQGKVQTNQFDSQGKVTQQRILSQGEALRFIKHTGSNVPQPEKLIANRTVFKSTLISGLVTHYSFDRSATTEDAGTKDTALDGSVSDDLSLFEGAKVVSDPGGQGKRSSQVLQLTGAQDYATAKGNSVDLKRPGSFTISLWAKFAKPMNQQGTFPALLIKSGLKPSGVYNYYCGMNGTGHDATVPFDHLRFTFYDDTEASNKQRLRFAWDGDAGRWHHYTYVFDHRAMKMRFYLDGNLKLTTIADEMPVTNDFDLLIGCSSSVAGNWDGWLDDIRIYKRPLNDKKAMQLYHEGLTAED